MAEATNTASFGGAVGMREDLSDVIHKLDVMDTPLYSGSKKDKAKNVNHDWLTDEIRQGGDNAANEGDITAATARQPRVRLQNHAQIIKEIVTISGSAQAGDYAGNQTLMAREIYKTAKALKKDAEFALFQNQARVQRVTGGSPTPGRMAGLPTWLFTNTIAGTGGADATGDGSDARTDGTAATFTEANLSDTMQSIWNEGGKPDVVYLRPDILDTASSFTGAAPRREMKEAGKVTKMVDVYMTNFGTVRFQPSREVRATDVFVLESSRVRVAELRGWQNKPLAKLGDAENRELLAEITLVCGNEKALGLIADRQAA